MFEKTSLVLTILGLITYLFVSNSTNVSASTPQQGLRYGLVNVDGVCGDLDDNGRLDIVDVSASLQILAGMFVPDVTQQHLGDVNRDGVIGLGDAIRSLRKLVGFVPSINLCGLLPPPYDLDLTPTSDTGLSDTDNITGDSTPTITLASEPGTTVSLFVDAVFAVEVPGGGATEVIMPVMSDGTRTITAQSLDVEGNLSKLSNPLEIVIDTTEVPPVRFNGNPTGFLPSGTSQTNLSLETDEVATCRFGTTADVDYDSLPNTFSNTGGTGHDAIIDSLVEDTDYAFHVRCQDVLGNVNADDFEITFSVFGSSDSAPWKLGFIKQPDNVTVDNVISPIQVAVHDQVGGVVASKVVPITIALANNTEGATLSGATTVETVGGIATFSDLSVDAPGSFSFVVSAPIKLLGSWDGGGKYLSLWGEGDTAYLGHLWENGGVDVLDVSDPTTPVFINNWGWGSENPQEGVQVQDGIGYFGSEVGTGAAIVDFTDPESPEVLSRITSENGGYDYVHNTFLDGKYWYLMSNRGPDVLVFDVSNPREPVKVQVITSPTGGAIHDVTAVNGRLYMHENTFDGPTHIVDVSDVVNEAPLIGSFPTGSSTHSGWWTKNFDHIVVARETLSSGGDAGIFDVRDPENVVRVATLDPVELGFGDIWPHDPKIAGDILYLAWNTAGLKIFEISDPSDPILIGSYKTSDASGPELDGTLEVFPFLGPDRVLASDFRNGLFVFDTTPTSTRSQTFDVSTD